MVNLRERNEAGRKEKSLSAGLSCPLIYQLLPPKYSIHFVIFKIKETNVILLIRSTGAWSSGRRREIMRWRGLRSLLGTMRVVEAAAPFRPRYVKRIPNTIKENKNSTNYTLRSCLLSAFCCF